LGTRKRYWGNKGRYWGTARDALSHIWIQDVNS
jgi:hypothetical protein